MVVDSVSTGHAPVRGDLVRHGWSVERPSAARPHDIRFVPVRLACHRGLRAWLDQVGRDCHAMRHWHRRTCPHAHPESGHTTRRHMMSSPNGHPIRTPSVAQVTVMLTSLHLLPVLAACFLGEKGFWWVMTPVGLLM